VRWMESGRPLGVGELGSLGVLWGWDTPFFLACIFSLFPIKLSLYFVT
jgi:hypothetical protein